MRDKVLHPCRGASSFYPPLITGRCGFARPPATCFDASGIILIRCIMCGRDNYISNGRGLFGRARPMWASGRHFFWRILFGRARPMRASGRHCWGFADLTDVKKQGWAGFCRPTLVGCWIRRCGACGGGPDKLLLRWRWRPGRRWMARELIEKQ